MITQPSDSFPSMIETLEGHSLLIPRLAKWFYQIGMSDQVSTEPWDWVREIRQIVGRASAPRLLQPWTTKHKRGYFVIFDLMHYGSFRSLFFPYSAKISPSSDCFVTDDSREKTSKKRSPKRIRVAKPRHAMHNSVFMASRPPLSFCSFRISLLLFSFFLFWWWWSRKRGLIEQDVESFVISTLHSASDAASSHFAAHYQAHSSQTSKKADLSSKSQFAINFTSYKSKLYGSITIAHL